MLTSNLNVNNAKDKIRKYIWDLDYVHKYYEDNFLNMVYTNQIDVFMNYLIPEIAEELTLYLDKIEAEREARGDYRHSTMKDDVIPYFLKLERSGGGKKRRQTRRRRQSR